MKFHYEIVLASNEPISIAT